MNKNLRQSLFYFVGTCIGAITSYLFLTKFYPAKITTIDVINSPALGNIKKDSIATIDSQINQLADIIEKAEKDSSNNLNKNAIAENHQKISSLYSMMASTLNGSMPNFVSQDYSTYTQ
jgi:uncharacterized membrane protein YqgA involved in biofilm formation